MNQCSYTKPNGERCRLAANGPDGVCWHHDPKNSGERRRTASRGGRGRVNTKARAVKKLMDDLTAQVLAGDVEPSVSHAVVALQNIKLRAIEVDRRLEEFDVRERLEAYRAEVEELKREIADH